MRAAQIFLVVLTALAGCPALVAAQPPGTAAETTDQTTTQPAGANEALLPAEDASESMLDFAFFDQLDRAGTEILPLAFQQPVTPTESMVLPAQDQQRLTASDYRGSFTNDPGPVGIGVDLYSPPEFEGGLLVFGDRVALKIGGYVKADFIYDFNAIDSTDSFVTTQIPVGAPDRTNARFHARQSRLSFDTRWKASEANVRIFVEGDFFSEGNGFRLRHAYGESGHLLVGQTWTTFTDVAAAPATLDFEGSVSSVNRRQAQARFTGSLPYGLEYSLAIEDTESIIEPPMGITGDARSPSPDFVARIRAEREWGRFQIAYLYRTLGFQPTGADVITANGWGFNTTAVVLLTEQNKAYSQIVFGDGIGSYRSLPDVAPASSNTAQLLGLLGWMIGVTHEWSDTLSSNFTYAENRLDNAPLQRPDEVHKTTYFAANLLSQPIDRVTVGVEYLYGIRQNIDRRAAKANRVQFAVIFDLP